MLRLCLLVVLAFAASVLANDGGHKPKADGHTHHHYYAHVTNNVHHHHDDDDDDDHHDKDDDDDDDDDHYNEDHVYRFQIGDGNFGAYAYLDDNGHLQGAFIDLIKAVCKKAGKHCHWLLDDFQRCWQVKGEEEHPGLGLLFHAYDGCMGFLPTPERENSFTFTQPFSLNPKAGIFFAEGHAPENAADVPLNLTGRTVGFVNGWAMNAQCVRRQDTVFGGVDFNSKFYDTYEALVDGLHHDEVDAIVSVDITDAAKHKLVHVGPWFKCSSNGLSVMTHYGSKVPKWWNQAMNDLKEEHGWAKLCETANKIHGAHGKIYCVE